MHLIRLQEESKMMLRTWNHLAWRRAARASRHFSLSKTSAGSVPIPEGTSKNGFQGQNGEEERVFDQVSEAGREQTHCHTYQGCVSLTTYSGCLRYQGDRVQICGSPAHIKGAVWCVPAGLDVLRRTHCRPGRSLRFCSKLTCTCTCTIRPL